MEAKRILARIGFIIILAACCTTVQGQKIKKILNNIDKAINVNGQNPRTNRQNLRTKKTPVSTKPAPIKSVPTQSSPNNTVVKVDDGLIFDIEKINQQLIDVKLDENDLYRYPAPYRFYDYEVVTKYDRQINGPKTTILKYPNLTYTSDLYEKAMEGDPIAQNKLGYCYLVGLGIKRDESKAKLFFTESAKNGMYESAVTLYRENFSNGGELLKQIADKNYGPACYAYYELSRSNEYLMMAARLLYPSAYRELGELAFRRKLYKESLELFNRAEELGNHKNDPRYSPFKDETILMGQAYYYYHSEDIADNEKFFIQAKYPSSGNEFYYNQINQTIGYLNLSIDDLYHKLEAENKLTDNIILIYNAMKFKWLDEIQQYKFRKSLEELVENSNNIYASAELGKFYYEGKGVAARDFEKASFYLTKAADGGLKYAARTLLSDPKRLLNNDKNLIYKYEEMVDPYQAKQKKQKAEDEKARMTNMLEDMKPFVGTWKKDNIIFVFHEKGDVIITATYIKDHRVKDPLFNYNKTVYDVNYTTVVECKTVYKVENNMLAFMEAIPFKVKSLEINKPSNPNEYVKEYIYKHGIPLAPQPILDRFSGKITIVSPTEIMIAGSGGTITLTKIK